MRDAVRAVHELVGQVEPVDELEARHLADTLLWLESTDDVFRRRKPDVPDRHLVAYAVLMAADGAILLADHLLAGRWLPTGGHVEPDEHPAQTARREVREELGVDVPFAPPGGGPRFVTVSQTVGPGTHTDVSLWFVLEGRTDMPLLPDPQEFEAVRWWTPAEVRAEQPSRFDPGFLRFMDKIGDAVPSPSGPALAPDGDSRGFGTLGARPRSSGDRAPLS